jgi:uncharacterized protein YbjT (DUF2867 family)
MKILLTGANGYIGRRLLPALLEKGHEVICLVRDPRRFSLAEGLKEKVTIRQADLLNVESLKNLPLDLDAAFYLVHSMGSGKRDFYSAEAESARNFTAYLNRTSCGQLVYVSGISNDAKLSKHLKSRKNVEDVLGEGTCPVTVLRAAIIIGSGSASFEIIRDLVEKLPVMIAPRWLNSRCQPIGIRDVIYYLTHVLEAPVTKGKTYDIGGPDILTYKVMLLRLAKLRGLKRHIITVPVLTPRLSSYWLMLVTSTTFALARNLAESLKNDVLVSDDAINKVLPHKCMSYESALNMAFTNIEQNTVISSWTDALVSGSINLNYMDLVQIPENGVLMDKRKVKFDRSPEEVMANVWAIGGDRGWYQSNLLWRMRGRIDKLIGGVGLSRPRRSSIDLRSGDALDFWRVLVADKPNKRLLLFAEMKVPGDAWLQFQIITEDGANYLEQLAAFRPRGLVGRLYWYAMLPFHGIIFKGMINNLIRYGQIY